MKLETLEITFHASIVTKKSWLFTETEAGILQVYPKNRLDRFGTCCYSNSICLS
ncbi:MAG: hypothetical protein GY749_15400 [Desulfobacteraceae bacterium]|nr:hypothetical protein [Desulfobacteraceae bacterium]